MALKAFVTSVSGTGVQGILGDDDDAFVAQGVAVASTDGVAITATGSFQRVDIFGSVVGATRAITMGNDQTADHDQTLYVAKTGYLAGYSGGLFAVRLDAYSSTLLNEGVISALKSGGSGISMGGNVVDTLSTLTNSGTIQAATIAIDHFGTDNMLLTNRGTIKGTYDGGEAKDTIVNTGKITGDASLFGGNDKFDTRDGSYSGTVDAGAGADKLYGSSKADDFHGGADADNIYTYNGDDFLFGDAGDDYLSASDGKDSLTGGLGKDQLRGGVGADKFIFATAGDSTVSAAGRDLILDFSQSQKDKIDLSAIDAKISTPVDNTFKFIGTGAYTNSEGELRYKIDGGVTKIYGDTNGDGASDFAIWIDKVVTLTAGDFIL